MAGAGGRRPAIRRCAGAAGFGADRTDGRAGTRSDSRRDPRQPASAAGAATRFDGRRAGWRFRAARRAVAATADRGEVPAARRGASGPGPAAAAARRRRAHPGPGAAFLERATVLTPNPAQRAGRALAAAQAKVQAGGSGAALDLLAMAEAGPLSELQHARVDLARAQLAFATSRGSDAVPLLLQAAKRLEPIHAGLAPSTYLDAMIAANFAGRLAGPGADVLAVARAVSAAPPPLHAPGASDLLLDGLATHYNEGYAAALPILRRALIAFGGGMPADQELRWLSLAFAAAIHIWDDDRAEVLSKRYVERARKVRALIELPLALSRRPNLLLSPPHPTPTPP